MTCETVHEMHGAGKPDALPKLAPNATAPHSHGLCVAPEKQQFSMPKQDLTIWTPARATTAILHAMRRSYSRLIGATRGVRP